MEKVLGDKKAICIFVLPAFIVFFGIIILPIFLSGYYSLLKWDGIGKSSFVGLQNYYQLLVQNSDGFLQSVSNSVILAALSVFIQLPLALLFALILASGIKGEGFFRSVYFIPVVVSTVVIGQLWMKIYHPEYGLLNVFLKSIGFSSWNREWLGSTETALMSVFIPLVWQYIGYHMLLMYASIKSISPEIMEAAKIDGAGPVKTALRITIPLITPILEVCVTFAVIGSLKTFDLIYILTNGGPVHATEVPSTLMFNTIFHKYMYGYGSAMAMFIIIECLLLTIVIQKLFRLRSTTY
ncbi:MAG: raffinose/stachyose/melibiose transport system permease protein [Petroclostridium sp.]|jgi:raffinose/stachyose/melibiose transport system permease protein|nr:transporter permease [Clostridia bacterium]MDK2809755.1 raffinose/stachyose/melibiose transport system permease protein [Petroclostridium sp.]